MITRGYVKGREVGVGSKRNEHRRKLLASAGKKKSFFQECGRLVIIIRYDVFFEKSLRLASYLCCF